MKKSLILVIIFSILLIFGGILIFAFGPTNNKSKNNKENNKEKNIEKAKNIITDNSEEKKELEFKKIDKDGNYVFKLKDDKNTEYVVDLKNKSYVINYSQVIDVNG